MVKALLVIFAFSSLGLLFSSVGLLLKSRPTEIDTVVAGVIAGDKVRANLLQNGFSVKVSDHQFRCYSCNKMQPEGSDMIMVLDGVRRGDSPKSAYSANRAARCNGSFSGWCLACATPFGVEAVGPKKERGGITLAPGESMTFSVPMTLTTPSPTPRGRPL